MHVLSLLSSILSGASTVGHIVGCGSRHTPPSKVVPSGHCGVGLSVGLPRSSGAAASSSGGAAASSSGGAAASSSGGPPPAPSGGPAC